MLGKASRAATAVVNITNTNTTTTRTSTNTTVAPLALSPVSMPVLAPMSQLSTEICSNAQAWVGSGTVSVFHAVCYAFYRESVRRVHWQPWGNYNGNCYESETLRSDLGIMSQKSQNSYWLSFVSDSIPLVLWWARCRVGARARTTPSDTGVRLKREPKLVHLRYPSACSGYPRCLAYLPLCGCPVHSCAMSHL